MRSRPIPCSGTPSSKTQFKQGTETRNVFARRRNEPLCGADQDPLGLLAELEVNVPQIVGDDEDRHDHYKPPGNANNRLNL